MRIRKRWPLTSHLPPFTTIIPDRSSFSAPSDHQNQQQEDEEKKKGILSTRDGRKGGLPLHQTDQGSNNLDRPTSNLHHMLLMRKRNGWIRTDGGIHMKALERKEEEGDEGDEEEEENELKWVDGEKRSSNMRNVNSSSVEMAARLMLPPFSSSHQGKRVFSFKKKRGERAEETMEAKEKKLTHDLGHYSYKEVVRDGVERDFKKKGRGNNSTSDAAMEGSRCSRVNGRGWRCSQQTLVGYALCEHHLGKGRLRSISSVPNRTPAISSPPKNAVDLILSLPYKLQEEEEEEEEEEDDDDDDDDEKWAKKMTATTKKRRKKIGMVKARSINSLLDQTHHAI